MEEKRSPKHRFQLELHGFQKASNCRYSCCRQENIEAYIDFMQFPSNQSTATAKRPDELRVLS
jgi:hypothetical protein